jgi:hypothetical protein
MSKQKEDLENNKVLLWGENPVNKELLKDYDFGNRNPQSISRKKKTDDKKPDKKSVSKRQYKSGETYTIDDIDFLDSEYDRIDKISSSEMTDELYDLQDELYELIDKLKSKKDKEDRLKEEKEEKINKESSNSKNSKIDALNKQLSELRDKYISSKGDPKIREEISEVEVKLNKLYKSGGSVLPVKRNKQKNISSHYNYLPVDNTDKRKNNQGMGFKKGSPEALEQARKMRESKENKQTGSLIKEKQESKSRVVKGSEEAKERGRKLAEARRLKKEIKQTNEELREEPKEETKSNKKPWYYIGDIPKGYREAIEDEAIKNNKVSHYGKYTVDSEKYRLFNEYNILLTEDIDDRSLGFSLSGLKRRIIKSLQEIEILSSKLDNDKYKDSKNKIQNKLEDEKLTRKYLQAGWNWFYKVYCKRFNKTYERKKFELPEKKVIEYTKSPEIPKIEVKNIPKIIKQENSSIEFKRDFNDMISLKKEYFDDDLKLKSKYAKKLFDKNIILDEQFYKPDDRNLLFYSFIKTDK